MSDQAADPRKTSSPLRDQMEAAMLRDDFTIATMADAAWAVIEPELIDQFAKRDHVIRQLAKVEAERDRLKATLRAIADAYPGLTWTEPGEPT